MMLKREIMFCDVAKGNNVERNKMEVEQCQILQQNKTKLATKFSSSKLVNKQRKIEKQNKKH